MKSIIVLFSQKGERVLLMDGKNVPSFAAEKNVRPVWEVSTWCKTILGCDIVCLFMFEHPRQSSEIVFVCRTWDDIDVGVVDGYSWGDIAEFNSHPVLSEIANRVRLETCRYESGEEPNFFCRYGWVEELQAWLKTAGIQVIHEALHLNASPFFSLIRFATDAGAIWFKAVGPPNNREFGVSVLLDRVAAGRVPRVIATNEKWRAWLSEEVAGNDLSESNGRKHWIAAFEGLAELQMASIAKVGTILNEGAAPWPIERILSNIDEFFFAMTGIMAEQPKQPPMRLTSSEIDALRIRTAELCLEMRDLRIPDTLLHGDIGPLNIIISPRGPIFIDWAEAYVGNPFLAAELLRRHYLRTFSDAEESSVRIEDAYGRVWRTMLPQATISRAWELAACIAPLFNALFLSEAHVANQAVSADRKALFRSVTRLMKKEVDLLDKGLIAC